MREAFKLFLEQIIILEITEVNDDE